MALFFSAEAKERPGQAVQVEIENLRAELQRTKDTARLRARQPSLTDEEIEGVLAEEETAKQNKAQKAASDEVNRQNQIRLDKEYRDLAVTLVKEGKMLISVGGKRLKSITPDLIFPCYACGIPLEELSHVVYSFAKDWYWADQPGAAVDRVASFLIYSAHSPLTNQGFAGFVQRGCPKCGKHDGKKITGVQMVLI